MNALSIKVLFDGGCPLCRREIGHYQELAALQPIQWVDITRDESTLTQLGVGRGEAMAQFHVFDSAGRLHVGAEGFVVLWQALPYYRWLAKVCLGLNLLPLMRWGYGHFSRWHLKRRCTDDVCQ